MQLLVRKINRSKWNNADEDIFKLSSDAITSCLRSSRNTLSVWKIESESDLDEAVLALISNFQKLESIDIVTLDGDYLIKAMVEQEQTEGITPISDLVDSHYDLKNLNYYKIGIVAEHIIQRIKLNKVKRYTINELKRILKKAIEQHRLKIEDLHVSVAELVR
jgi:hypothetical protein